MRPTIPRCPVRARQGIGACSKTEHVTSCSVCDVTNSRSADRIKVLQWPKIDDLQVIQKDLDGIIFEAVKGPGFRDDSERELRSYIAQTCGPDFNVEIRYVEAIPLLPSGKRRYVVSEVAEQHYGHG